MSIFDKQQDLENLPDQALVQLGQQPSPQYPSYLVMAEVERRRDMRQRHEAEMAKHQAANPPDIATQRMDELGGIAGVDPAMGQQPPPEEMAALQGGIAGGPPPGMEQMGGPPPGMEGQPPMMAYGGLIPGYQDGGLHPDPDERPSFLDLYSENLPGTEDYEREGLFGRAQDLLFGEGADRRREASERRMRAFEWVPPDERTPEYEQEREEAMREVAASILPVGSTRAVGAGASKLFPKLMPAIRGGVSRATGAVSRRMPGAAGRATRALEQTAKSLDEAATAARATVDAMVPGQRGIVAARAAAVEAEKAAATAAARLTRFPAVIERTQGISRTGREAGRGRLNRASRWGLGFPRRHPVITAGGLGTLAYATGDEPEESGSGLETLLRRGWSGIRGGAAGARDVYEDFMPDWGDLPGGAARRAAAAAADDDGDVVSGDSDVPQTFAQMFGDRAASDAVTADELADVGAGRRSTGEIAAARRAEIETARVAANTLSQDEKDLSQLRRDEASRETELLARELGLSTERVAELRGEMRTEKETDHARKARLFSGLGAALMGSPRGLGSALQSTTTGLEDLDEALRVERRRDLGDIHEQRAKGIDIERSGRRGIASLRASDLEMLIDRARAGDSDAQAALTSLTGQEMQAASAYDQMAMQIRRASNERDLANMPSYVEFEEMAADEKRAIELRTDIDRLDKDARQADIDEAISAFRNQNMGLALSRMNSALRQ